MKTYLQSQTQSLLDCINNCFQPDEDALYGLIDENFDQHNEFEDLLRTGVLNPNQLSTFN